MDWLWVALLVVLPVTKAGIKIDRRPRKSTRIRRTKGDQPPEPPEGRY